MEVKIKNGNEMVDATIEMANDETKQESLLDGDFSCETTEEEE